MKRLIVLLALLAWTSAAPAPVIRLEADPTPGQDCTERIAKPLHREFSPAASWELLRIWIGPTEGD